MIQKMNNRPEEIILVSGVKEIGQDINLNRERTAITILGIAQASTQELTDRFDEYTKDGAIDDVEKQSLSRELDTITRDFQQLRSNTKENNLGDSEEYKTYEANYNKLYALLTKIINWVGIYDGTDIRDINTYYADYTNSATVLANRILEVQTEEYRISTYYSRTSVSVSVYPEAVPSGGTTTISASITYEGVDKLSLVSANAFSFGLTGLASGIQSSAFTLPSGGSVVITELTHSAVVTGCKSFQLAYAGIGSTGVSVTVQVTLDSDSMPF